MFKGTCVSDPRHEPGSCQNALSVHSFHCDPDLCRRIIFPSIIWPEVTQAQWLSQSDDSSVTDIEQSPDPHPGSRTPTFGSPKASHMAAKLMLWNVWGGLLQHCGCSTPVWSSGCSGRSFLPTMNASCVPESFYIETKPSESSWMRSHCSVRSLTLCDCLH